MPAGLVILQQRLLIFARPRGGPIADSSGGATGGGEK
jgi:hypothetical protein